MRKIIDYNKYTRLFIEDISQILTNDDRKIESQERTVDTYQDRLEILTEYFIKNNIDLKRIDKYDVEKIFKHIQNKGYMRAGKHMIYSKSTMRLFKCLGI
jgi:hypothetical protein